MKPLASQRAFKTIGDCYLLAFAESTGSVLVTFDATLHRLADRQGAAVIEPH
jgi:predicted nucleic acid-binding protein